MILELTLRDWTKILILEKVKKKKKTEKKKLRLHKSEIK